MKHLIRTSVCLAVVLTVHLPLLASSSNAESNTAVIGLQNKFISAGPNGNTRFVIAPPLGSFERLHRDGFIVEIKARLGVDFEGTVLGGHALDVILAPAEIAGNQTADRANIRNLLYLNLKGNGQWDLFHAGEKVAGQMAGPDHPFRTRDVRKKGTPHINRSCKRVTYVYRLSPVPLPAMSLTTAVRLIIAHSLQSGPGPSRSGGISEGDWWACRGWCQTCPHPQTPVCPRPGRSEAGTDSPDGHLIRAPRSGQAGS